jgi:hypothetical protein
MAKLADRIDNERGIDVRALHIFKEIKERCSAYLVLFFSVMSSSGIRENNL